MTPQLTQTHNVKNQNICLDRVEGQTLNPCNILLQIFVKGEMKPSYLRIHSPLLCPTEQSSSLVFS